MGEEPIERDWVAKPTKERAAAAAWSGLPKM